MLKRFASAALVAALVLSLGGTSAFADTAPKPDNKSGEAAARAGTGTEAGKESQANEKLKADILKRIADAKAGKTAMAFPRPQQPPQRNNLSKGQKIRHRGRYRRGRDRRGSGSRRPQHARARPPELLMTHGSGAD